MSEPTRLKITPATSHVGVEGAVAVDDRRRRARHRGRVDDEQHRRVEQLRDVRGRGQLAAARGAVEEAHDALDDRDVGAGDAVADERRDQLRAAEEGVEVAARPAGGERVVAGVDVVGADLEALHASARGARSAPISPQATVVLPAPELVPATTMRGITPPPSHGRGQVGHGERRPRAR